MRARKRENKTHMISNKSKPTLPLRWFIKNFISMRGATLFTKVSITCTSRQPWQEPALSKVAGCWWKSLPTWLVLAGYSAWRFLMDDILNKISLDWLLTLTTWPSTSELSDNPEDAHVETDWLLFKSFSNYWTVFHYITQDSKVGCSPHRLPLGPCRDITSFYTHKYLGPFSWASFGPFCRHRHHKSNKGTKQ